MWSEDVEMIEGGTAMTDKYYMEKTEEDILIQEERVMIIMMSPGHWTDLPVDVKSIMNTIAMKGILVSIIENHYHLILTIRPHHPMIIMTTRIMILIGGGLLAMTLEDTHKEMGDDTTEDAAADDGKESA